MVLLYLSLLRINMGQISATNLTNHNHFFNFTDRCCSKCILPIDLTNTLFTWCLTGQCTLVNTRTFMFENLIEFTEIRHYVVYTVCTAFISQTIDKPFIWLEGKKTTKISIFEFVMEFSGVSWCFSQFHVSISALFIPKPPRHWSYLVAQPNFISTPKARESEELATISAHLDRQLYLLFSFHKPIKARQLLHQIKWKTV